MVRSQVITTDNNRKFHIENNVRGCEIKRTLRKFVFDLVHCPKGKSINKKQIIEECEVSDTTAQKILRCLVKSEYLIKNR